MHNIYIKDLFKLPKSVLLLFAVAAFTLAFAGFLEALYPYFALFS